jgi:transposase
MVSYYDYTIFFIQDDLAAKLLLKKRPNRFEFVYTPKHGSWLNMVEILFCKMARSFLRGIRVASKEELVERIYRYIDELNASPVIFRWKYKLDEMSVA